MQQTGNYEWGAKHVSSDLGNLTSPDSGAIGAHLSRHVASAGKYLTFKLAEEQYGIRILSVQEIIGLQQITVMPNAPEWVRGVINLRGRVIPVVDLRRRFNIEPTPDTERTCIIVTSVVCDGRALITGIVVDMVSEVVDIGAAQIEPTPAFGAGLETQYLLGMAKLAERVVMILSVEEVVDAAGRQQTQL